MFEVDRVTCLATDWSKEGVGFFMFQKYCDCQDIKMGCCKEGWQVVLAGSRFLRQNEKNWCPGEGEGLAVVYALNKTKHFVLGCKQLYVATDHKPLLGTFGDRSLEQVENPRLRRLKEKTKMFDFKMIHVPARKHAGPDALSRNPICREGLMGDMNTKDARLAVLAGIRVLDKTIEKEEKDPAVEMAEDKLCCYVCPMLASHGVVVEAVTWERVQQAAMMDPVMQELKRLLEEGFPETRNEMGDSVREFFKFREHLSMAEGAILYKDRVVIPRMLRREILEGLHAGHQGVVSMRARAANCVFWPGIDRAIQDVRNRCKTCDYIAPSQANEPSITAEPPVYPFQKICTDYFQLDGATYLVIVDRYSGWPSIVYYPDTTATSKGLVDALREWFQIFGVPEELASDGQSTYTSQVTQDFLKAWGVKHRLSSTYFPHSNTRAELGVKAMKRLMRDNTGPRGDLDTDAFARALLMYRNTPMQGVGLSPAQIIFGRELRDTMPFQTSKGAMHEEWRITAEDREKALAKRQYKTREKLNEHVKELKPLQVGQSVLVQNQSGNHGKRWARTGTVVETGPGPRQYAVRMDGSRNVSLRNRKYLRSFTGVSDVMADDVVHSNTIPQQHPSEVDGQVVSQEGAVGEESQAVDHEESTAEQVTLPTVPQDQDASGAAAGEGHRYPRRVRRKPSRFKDFEMDDSG